MYIGHWVRGAIGTHKNSTFTFHPSKSNFYHVLQQKWDYEEETNRVLVTTIFVDSNTRKILKFESKNWEPVENEKNGKLSIVQK